VRPSLRRRKPRNRVQEFLEREAPERVMSRMANGAGECFTRHDSWLFQGSAWANMIGTQMFEDA
jgi:hypothetical protein